MNENSELIKKIEIAVAKLKIDHGISVEIDYHSTKMGGIAPVRINNKRSCRYEDAERILEDLRDHEMIFKNSLDRVNYRRYKLGIPEIKIAE